jgi:hypothetical protein
MPLAPRKHEHDHFPVPLRNGGEDTVCACINCHDLKDRARFSDYLPEFLAAGTDLWTRAEPLERIWLARLMAMATDTQAESARAES